MYWAVDDGEAEVISSASQPYEIVASLVSYEAVAEELESLSRKVLKDRSDKETSKLLSKSAEYIRASIQRIKAVNSEEAE